MSDKIITQRAQGYGSEPVTVTVQIDGATILQGPIPTLDQPPPALPDFWTPELGVDCWTWTVDASFDGTQTLTISVDNGKMYMFDTFYNLSDQPGNAYPLSFDQQQGNVEFTDPFSAVTINGVPRDPVRDTSHAGQWVWQLYGGDVFSCTVNLTPALSPPAESTPE